MDITVNPDLPLIICYFFHLTFNEMNLRVKLLIRLGPLSIQIDASHRVTIITANDTIRVLTRHQHKSVVKSQKLGFFPI